MDAVRVLTSKGIYESFSKHDQRLLSVLNATFYAGLLSNAGLSNLKELRSKKARVQYALRVKSKFRNKPNAKFIRKGFIQHQQFMTKLYEQDKLKREQKEVKAKQARIGLAEIWNKSGARLPQAI